MAESLATRVSCHAAAGDLAAGRAMEAALAAQRLYESAAAKQQEAVRHLADAAAAFAAVRAAAGVPASPPSSVPRSVDHPTPPPTTTRSLVLACLGLGVAGTLACSFVPEVRPVNEESGKAALRRGNWCKAETMFARAGDELGIAEALINQKRYDEAAIICDRYPQDGKAKLFLGLIARARGDAGGAFILLSEAKELGSKEARDLLTVEAKKT